MLPLGFVLALVAAACAEPPTPSVDVGSGLRFLPEVADSLNDAGRYPSIVTNPDGLPVVAYFGFEEKLEEGEVPISRPVGSPSIPGVLLAGLSDQGYWTRGAIAIADQIPNVSIAFNPAFEPSVADLTPEDVTGLAMVADGEDYHAVWGIGRWRLATRPARSTPPPRRRRRSRRSPERPVSVPRSHSSTACRGSRSTRRPRSSATVAARDAGRRRLVERHDRRRRRMRHLPHGRGRSSGWPGGRLLERWGWRAGRVERRRERLRELRRLADRWAGTLGRGNGLGAGALVLRRRQRAGHHRHR